MTRPTRSQQVIDHLPTLYYRDPTLRRLVESVAGRLAQLQQDLDEVMNSHWVDSADSPPIGERAFLRDLPRIAAIVPLATFEDEAAAQSARETVLLDSEVLLTAPGNLPLGFEDLAPGQRLFAGGSRLQDGALLATRVSLAKPPPAGSVFEAIEGLLLEAVPASLVDPRAKLILQVGPSASDLFRQRLKLTVEAFLAGAGTAPAILKMVAATMGWGPLRGGIEDWSAEWRPDNPLFEAKARGAPQPIRLREQPLRRADSPRARRVKAGARWTERNESNVVVRPRAVFRALDKPVLIPTLINLDAKVSIATVVALETEKTVDDAIVRQAVTLELVGRADGTIGATLIERLLPAGGVTVTDVSDRVVVRTSALRVDQAGASGFLKGGGDGTSAGLVISDGRRAIQLTARTDGLWGNAIEVSHSETGVRLRYDPPLAVGAEPSLATLVFEEELSLPELVEGSSKLVTARDFTFTIPEGESHWAYVDHLGWTTFDVGTWDGSVFDVPDPEVEDLQSIVESYPIKGLYDYANYGNAVFPREIVGAFRFDRSSSVYDAAFFNETVEQVEVELGWLEGQRATIQIDVPIGGEADLARIGALPEMVDRVKASGIKVILSPRSAVREFHPLGEAAPIVQTRINERQPLGERLRIPVRGLQEIQPLDTRILGHFGTDRWNGVRFG